MSDEPTPGVLGGLPRTRPHRRSAKRPAPAPPTIADQPEVEAATRAVKAPPGTSPRKPPAAKATRRAKAEQARAVKTRGASATGAAKNRRSKAANAEPRSKPTRARPSQPRSNPAPPPPARQAPLGTAVQAAAELAEIGLMVGARAIRGALARLPRP